MTEAGVSFVVLQVLHKGRYSHFLKNLEIDTTFVTMSIYLIIKNSQILPVKLYYLQDDKVGKK